MKTRCPTCGTTVSLDALVAHEAAREALMVVFALSGPLGSAIVRYLGLFRPATRELTMDRVARLLGQLLPDVQAQRIERGGQTHPAPPEAWIWAIAQALDARDAGRLKLPMTSHGWLYEVISNWRPASAAIARTDAAAATGFGRAAASKTLSALQALEDRARD